MFPPISGRRQRALLAIRVFRQGIRELRASGSPRAAPSNTKPPGPPYAHPTDFLVIFETVCLYFTDGNYLTVGKSRTAQKFLRVACLK